ncbi:odorant receptor 13a-like [Cotesia glomerata]|uniref:odorant receptor 13a-like n=1 Tax=Cotesia glomerata TaxID=32391 RepID=UPI001D01BD91|nr:odorant receptor 13a-like [Cotesia glomerata]
MKKFSQDQKNLDDGVKMYDWMRWLSKGIGVWPLAPNDYLFALSYLYFTSVMASALIDLYISLGNLRKVIDNLSESLALMHLYTSTLMLRVHCGKLRYVLTELLKDYKINAFENSTELKIFLAHIKEGKAFAKTVLYFIAVTEVIWYILPVVIISSISVGENDTIPFILPYRFYNIYPISSTRNYILTYIWEGIYFFINSCSHMTSEGFLILFVYQLSGRFAILAERINDLKNNPDMYKSQLKAIVKEHNRLLKIGDYIRDAYATALFAYLINGTILMSMIGYQILLSFMTAPDSNLTVYFLFIFTMYFIITAFCIVSEQLTEANNKVKEAFWNCEWYQMDRECIYDITYCISRSQKPLALQAGKFLYFSNNTLTDVTKTSLGYLSILRNFLIVN